MNQVIEPTFSNIIIGDLKKIDENKYFEKPVFVKIQEKIYPKKIQNETNFIKVNNELKTNQTKTIYFKQKNSKLFIKKHFKSKKIPNVYIENLKLKKIIKKLAKRITNLEKNEFLPLKHNKKKFEFKPKNNNMKTLNKKPKSKLKNIFQSLDALDLLFN